MALINCPECGKQISDKAKKCIHCEKVFEEKKTKIKICNECGKEFNIDNTECSFCGCPLEKEKLGNSELVNMNTKKSKKDIKKIVAPMVMIIIIVVIVLGIYNVKVIKPQNTYNKAVALLDEGKYEEANTLFQAISVYKDVAEIQEQLKFESYSYSAISSLKQYLKNPDSYQPYEITFYESMNEEKISSENEEDKYPICIMNYGAQNGFGGNTTGYAICSYDKEKGSYKLLGTCDSLDEDEYDKDDEDDIYDLFICGVINIHKKNDNVVGTVDLSRLKNVLKNDSYTTIKIIEIGRAHV